NECVACSEHAHCPESACHLDGPDVGRCFDVGEVEMIADGTALVNAFDNVPDGGDRVLMLTGGIDDYTGVSVDFTTNAEVAIIGDGTQILTGTSSGSFLQNGSDSIVYFGSVSIGGNLSGSGLACSGSSVWLDDSEVRNNDSVGLTVSGGCAAHLRRSVVSNNNGTGATISGSGTSIDLLNSMFSNNDGGGIEAAGATTQVVLKTSVIASNGNNSSLFGGLSLDGTDLQAVYTTIAGNDSSNPQMSIRCLGSVSGMVRNSILVGEDPDSVGECQELMLTNSGTDGGDEPSNTVVGAFDVSWFEDPAMGDFRLSDLGRETFEGIAMWQDGDPQTDIDGDPISMETPSFPGYDQPSR
ncbi:MAG: right-handed parallel beta-helix repeat-containing protein, partial [Myxococcota bacterium]